MCGMLAGQMPPTPHPDTHSPVKPNLLRQQHATTPAWSTCLLQLSQGILDVDVVNSKAGALWRWEQHDLQHTVPHDLDVTQIRLQLGQGLPVKGLPSVGYNK